MPIGKLLGGIVWVLLVIGLAACGGDDSGSESGLSQNHTYILSTGMFTLYYPDGWVSADNAYSGIIGLASSQEVFESGYDFYPSLDDVSVIVIVGTTSEAMMTIIEENTTATDWMRLVLDEFDLQESGIVETTLGEIEEFNTSGEPAALVSGIVSDEQKTVGTIITVAQSGGMIQVFVFTVNQDAIEQHLPLARAMTIQAEFVPVETE